MQNFSKKAPYKVLRKDRNAHIVKDVASNTTSYVLFETPSSLPDELIQKADTSCLIMIEEIGRKLNLTICNPDLAMYRGVLDDIFDENGAYRAKHIFSPMEIQ